MDVDDDVFVQPSQIEDFPHNKLVVITTGSQGEPFSGLVLMSRGNHKYIKLGSKDLVVISALPVPGNERLVHRTINDLFRQGCEVIYEAEQNVHVSGHASREELKMMLSLVNPTYFVPLHGEYRHLVRHKQLAEEVGMPARNVFILEKGDVLSITKKQARTSKKVPVGAYIVDGDGYKRQDLNRTKEIADAIARYGVSIAQHGISGTPLDKAAMFPKYGINKGNVGTLWQNIIFGLEIEPETGNAVIKDGSYVKDPKRGIPIDLWNKIVAWADEQGYSRKSGDYKKANKPFHDQIMALPEEIQEQIVAETEEWATKYIKACLLYTS